MKTPARESLDIQSARALALAAGAGFPSPFPSGAEGVADAIRALGFVQIDTISVVRRAHEHILWSRVPDPGYAAVRALEGADEGERRVVEYWAHAAAYLPIEEWRFCLPRMERIRTSGHEWFRADPEAVSYVRDKVASEGPLSAREFLEPMSGPRGWWDWKPAKVALEYLFHAGELVCATRRNFQKVYDLTERQIPGEHLGPKPTESELAERHVERAAASLGLFTREEAVYQRKDGLAEMAGALEAGTEAGSLVGLTVEGLGSRGYYCRRELLNAAAGSRERGDTSKPASGRAPGKDAGRAFILSPFDPFLIDRKRCARLWDFDYSIECYLPAAKRKFGYFALPILYIPADDPGNARYAGLLDAKADRKNNILLMQRLRLATLGSVSPFHPPGHPASTPPTEAGKLALAVARELARFAAFQGASRSELGVLETDDPVLASALRKAIRPFL